MEPRCPRHPEKRARRRCFACRRPFCSRCEYRSDHHLFCGPACARQHAREKSRQRLRHSLTPEIPPRFAYLVIALLLASAAAASLNVANRLSRLEPEPRAARRARPAQANITHIAGDGAGVSLSGTAPDGFGVVLFSGGRLVSVTSVSAGTFQFSNISEPGPFRVGLLPLSGEVSVPEGIAPAPRAARGSARPMPEFAGPKRILVSFDAGSSDRGALQILDALKSRSIRTTIFLTGEFIRRYPGLTLRIAHDGHEVGNHTFNHPHLTTYARNGRQDTLPDVTEAFLRDELERAASLFRETTGTDMAPLWRAPFGEENAEIRGWARRAGYTHVSWSQAAGENLDSLDWVSDSSSPRYRSSERVVGRLLAMARPGGIILMHLGTDRTEDPVADRLPELLDALSARGYGFATATEFLSAREFPR
jgi:peptidoglycan/xylan/chitin deacetylase (PgdA/CDA1 family)